MTATPEFDLCVVGGGAAGLVVAAGGSGLGAKVALVEKSPAAMGGDCLHYGCVPSKTLLHSAGVAHAMRDAARFGIDAAEPRVDLARVMERVAGVIASIQPNDSPERFASLGVELHFGQGAFVSPSAFEVAGRRITARKFVLATGSRPAVPPIPGLADVPYLTNETVFALRENVPRLVVIGAGPIGCELAQAFRRLGSEVDVVDAAPRVLPREDADAADVVRASLAADGVRFHLGASVKRVARSSTGVELSIAIGDGPETTVPCSHLLVAAGRRANIEELGLDAAGIEVDKGRIVSDARLRTTNRNVFVCGDVAGAWQFTHIAEHHAGVVLRNALFRLPAKAATTNIPWCTFTEPELARVGLSEEEARARGADFEVWRFPFEEVDRGRAEGVSEGFAKLLTDRRGRLLGAAVVGPHAGEIIHEYVLAMSRGLRAKDISGTIHIYPTLAQINRRVADQRLKAGLTPGRKRLIQRIFGLRGTA